MISKESSFITSPVLKAWSILSNIPSAILVRDSLAEHLVVRAFWSSCTCWTGTALPCLSLKYLHKAAGFHSPAQSFCSGCDRAYLIKEQVSWLLLVQVQWAWGWKSGWRQAGGRNTYSQSWAMNNWRSMLYNQSTYFPLSLSSIWPFQTTVTLPTGKTTGFAKLLTFLIAAIWSGIGVLLGSEGSTFPGEVIAVVGSGTTRDVQYNFHTMVAWLQSMNVG